jgi:hypothetical protein
MAKLSTKTSVPKDTLLALADSRLSESEVLKNGGLWAASIYLGGYAVECYLKVAICETLDLDGLPKPFETHELEPLLMYSGLQRRLKSEAEVHDSFGKIASTWPDWQAGTARPSAGELVRYVLPSLVQEHDAESFDEWLNDPEKGVIPWLKKQV